MATVDVSISTRDEWMVCVQVDTTGAARRKTEEWAPEPPILDKERIGSGGTGQKQYRDSVKP